MISNSLTLEEASKLFCIPTSTIYEILNRIDDDLQKELYQLYQSNKSNMHKTIWQNKIWNIGWFILKEIRCESTGSNLPDACKRRQKETVLF